MSSKVRACLVDPFPNAHRRYLDCHPNSFSKEVEISHSDTVGLLQQTAYPYLMGYGFHISPKYLRSTDYYIPPTDEQLSVPGLSADDKMLLQMRSEGVASFVLKHTVHEVWSGATLKHYNRGPFVPARILVLTDNMNAYPRMPTEDEVATIREKLNLRDAQLGWYRVERD